jgi:endonuclease YncB( thermonuclease family)
MNAGMVRSFTLLCLAIFWSSAFADFTGIVVKVTDGDTVNVLEAGNVLHKVRLTGIDAPERAQPYGRKSHEYLAGMIAGKQVLIESNTQDRYGRDLGKVILNGQDINLEQIKAGMAWWYRYYKKQQSQADQIAYEEAEDHVRVNRLGLWAEENPIEPWRWRRIKH